MLLCANWYHYPMTNQQMKQKRKAKENSRNKLHALEWMKREQEREWECEKAKEIDISGLIYWFNNPPSGPSLANTESVYLCDYAIFVGSASAKEPTTAAATVTNTLCYARWQWSNFLKLTLTDPINWFFRKICRQASRKMLFTSTGLIHSNARSFLVSAQSWHSEIVAFYWLLDIIEFAPLNVH